MLNFFKKKRKKDPLLLDIQDDNIDYDEEQKESNSKTRLHIKSLQPDYGTIPIAKEERELSYHLLPPLRRFFYVMSRRYRDWQAWYVSENSYLERLFYLLFLREADIDKHVEIRWKQIWLRGQGILLEPSGLEKIARIKAVTQGKWFFFERLWKPVLLGLLSYDAFNLFLNPINQYGNLAQKGKQLVLGNSKFYSALSSHFGSDLADSITFKSGFGILFGLPLITIGLIYGYRRYLAHYNPDDKFSYLDSECTYNPIYLLGFMRDLHRAKFAILWDRRLEAERRYGVFHKIAEDVLIEDGSNSLTKLVLCDVLATIYMSLSDKDIEKYVDFSKQANELKNIKDYILTALQYWKAKDANEKCDPPPFYVRQMAAYSLWRIGHPTSAWHDVFFLPLSTLSKLISYYTFLHYFSTLVFKGMQLVQYLQARHACLQENKVYPYEARQGDYACLACDWPFIYSNDRSSLAGCVNGLFQQPRAFKFIMTYLEQVLPRAGYIETLDLSHQAIATWSVPQWKAFFVKLKEAHLQGIKRLILAQPQPRVLYLAEERFAVLVDFLDHVAVEQLNLTNIGLNAGQLPYFAAVVKSKVLDFRGCAIGDSGLRQLAMRMSTNVTEALYLGGNHVTAAGVKAVLPWLDALPLTTLELADNQIITLAPFAQLLQHPSLSVLLMARNNLGQADFATFGQGLVNSTLTHLDVSYTQINDEQLNQLSVYLQQSQLASINLSGNPFSQQGYAVLALHTNNATVTTLMLNNVQLDDTSFTTFLHYSTLPFETLQLSDNALTMQSVGPLLARLSDTPLTHLAMANNALGNTFITQFVNIAPQLSFQFQGLDISTNDITTFTPLLQVLPHTNLHTLISNDNLMSAQDFTLLGRLISQTNLTTIVLQQALQQETYRLDTWAANLPQSKLQAIGFRGGHFESGTGRLLAQHLIDTLGPIEKQIGNTKLNIDTKRQLAKATPATALINIDLSHSDIDTAGARALCQVAPVAKLPISGLHLADNPIDPHSVDIDNCLVSAATRLQPPPWLSLRFYYETQQSLFAWMLHFSGPATYTTTVTVVESNGPVRSAYPSMTDTFEWCSHEEVLRITAGQGAHDRPAHLTPPSSYAYGLLLPLLNLLLLIGLLYRTLAQARQAASPNRYGFFHHPGQDEQTTPPLQAQSPSKVLQLRKR